MVISCPVWGANYCDPRISVCLCLFVGSHIAKITCPNCTQFFVYATGGHGSVSVWRQCDMSCTSGFVDDVMSPYNAGNRPELKTTHVYVSSSSPGGGTVGDLRLHLLRFVYLCSTTSLTYHLQPEYVPMRYRFFESVPWIDLFDYLMIRSSCINRSINQ